MSYDQTYKKTDNRDYDFIYMHRVIVSPADYAHLNDFYSEIKLNVKVDPLN